MLKGTFRQLYVESGEGKFLTAVTIPKVVPESYKQGNVDQKVIKPIKEELTSLFRGLAIRKKYGKGRGKPVIGYTFAWKPERKNAEDVRVSEQQRLKDQLFNIEHNGELSEPEKWRAIDKVKGLALGTTEKRTLAERQAKYDNEIREQAKQELLAELWKGFDPNV